MCRPWVQCSLPFRWKEWHRVNQTGHLSYIRSKVVQPSFVGWLRLNGLPSEGVFPLFPLNSLLWLIVAGNLARSQSEFNEIPNWRIAAVWQTAYSHWLVVTAHYAGQPNLCMYRIKSGFECWFLWCNHTTGWHYRMTRYDHFGPFIGWELQRHVRGYWS